MRKGLPSKKHNSKIQKNKKTKPATTSSTRKENLQPQTATAAAALAALSAPFSSPSSSSSAFSRPMNEQSSIPFASNDQNPLSAHLYGSNISFYRCCSTGSLAFTWAFGPAPIDTSPTSTSRPAYLGDHFWNITTLLRKTSYVRYEESNCLNNDYQRLEEKAQTLKRKVWAWYNF